MAYACLVEFDRDVAPGGSRAGKYGRRFEFFMVVYVIGWVVVLFVYFIFLFGLEAKIAVEKNWNIFVSFCTVCHYMIRCIASQSLNIPREKKWEISQRRSRERTAQ